MKGRGIMTILRPIRSINTYHGIITYRRQSFLILMIEKFPLLPFIIFAGALISTATIGLPVFAG